MLKYILISNFREFKLIKDPLVYFTLSGIVSISLLLLLIVTNLIMNQFIFLLITNCLLFQYNVPLINDTIKSQKSMHYTYSKLVEYKYMLFIILKNNPLIIIGMAFNSILLLIYLSNIQLVLITILTILIQVSIFLSRLIQNTFLKLAIIFFTFIAIIVNIIIVNFYINVFLVLLLFYLFIQVHRSGDSFLQGINIIVNQPSKKLKKIDFNYKNMYIKLFLSYIRRITIKNYLMLIFIFFIYIVTAKKFTVNINFTSILIFLYLFDLELITDQQFREIEKTTAYYYLGYLSPLNKVKWFLLSEHFHKLIIYSGLILGLTFIEYSLLEVLSNILTILFMFLLGMTYHISTKKIVKYRKKFNGYVFQYLIILIIILFLLGKNFIIK